MDSAPRQHGEVRNFDNHYGSNADGLIWGYHFAPGQEARPIGTKDIEEFLGASPSVHAQEFVWLHFALSNQASERYMRRVLTLPDAFYESLRSEIGSTRLEIDEGALVAVIHDVLFDSRFDASDVGATTLCLGPRMMVSARLRPLRSIDQLRTSVRTGRMPRSPVDLLAYLLREQAEVLVDIVRKSTTRVDEIEDRLLSNQIATDRAQVGSLRRALVRLQRLLAPEPTALFRLLNRPPEWISKDDVLDLQQAAEEFSTAIGDSAALVERVKLIQEEAAALTNERSGRTLFILTTVTVLALPVNLVAGLFGMNVKGIPFADSDFGFATIVVSLLLLTALLAWFAFGRRE